VVDIQHRTALQERTCSTALLSDLQHMQHRNNANYFVVICNTVVANTGQPNFHTKSFTRLGQLAQYVQKRTSEDHWHRFVRGRMSFW